MFKFQGNYLLLRIATTKTGNVNLLSLLNNQYDFLEVDRKYKPVLKTNIEEKCTSVSKLVIMNTNYNNNNSCESSPHNSFNRA